jgi:hypothetical protein
MIKIDVKQNGKSNIIEFPYSATEILYKDFCDYRIWFESQPLWFKNSDWHEKEADYALKIIEGIRLLTKVDLSYLDLTNISIDGMAIKLDSLLHSILINCRAAKDASSIIEYKGDWYQLDDTRTVHLGIMAMYVENKYKVTHEGDVNDYNKTLYHTAIYARKRLIGRRETLPKDRQSCEALIETRVKHFQDITLQDAMTIRFFFRYGSAK